MGDLLVEPCGDSGSREMEPGKAGDGGGGEVV